MNFLYKTKNLKSGGKNTNKNGLKFEKDTELSINELELIDISKKNFENFLEENNLLKIKMKSAPHGCKRPDEVYLHKKTKSIFIIEKKFQNSSGSVCEKLQTGLFKRDFYTNNITEYTIYYIYVISEWLKDNCEYEIEYLQKHGLRVFCGSKKTYKKDILKYINQEIEIRKLPSLVNKIDINQSQEQSILQSPIKKIIEEI